jgi:hypothetical protein
MKRMICFRGRLLPLIAFSSVLIRSAFTGEGQAPQRNGDEFDVRTLRFQLTLGLVGRVLISGRPARY